jgi:hypothetical protein
MRFADSFAVAPSGQGRPEREARAAIAIAAGLYLVGAMLCATGALLPHVDSAAGIIAVAADALATSAGLFYAAHRGWGGLRLAFVADLWGIVLIAILCASGGGASSPFALIYFFAVGHAAAFQPRGRFLFVCGAALLAFLAPLAYEPHISTMFGAVAVTGIVLALLTSAVVHMSLNRMRGQRRQLEIMIAATAQLDKSLDPARTLRTIARMAVPDLAALCVIDLLDEDTDAIGSTVAAAVNPAVAAELERMRSSHPLDLTASNPVTQVLSGELPHVIYHADDPASSPRPAGGAEEQHFLDSSGYASAAVFPMRARGRTHGVISFWDTARDAHYDAALMAVLEDITGRAAMALDNARLYAERARVARTLRRSLLPAVLPVIPGLQLASYFRPMGAGEEVGGDFYDAFGDREGCWLIVGDVCGKGAEAAALTGFLRHTTAAYAREASAPGRVLAQVNQAMLDQDFDGRFATAILARLAFGEAGVELTLAVAGHPSALLVRGDGEVAEVGGSGTLLGIFPEPVIEEVSATLSPGDALVLYTDGLTEAHAPGKIVTPAEMIGQLRRTPPASAQGTIDVLLDLVNLNGRVSDDIAILAVQVGTREPAAANGIDVVRRRLMSARPQTAVADAEREQEPAPASAVGRPL